MQAEKAQVLQPGHLFGQIRQPSMVQSLRTHSPRPAASQSVGRQLGQQGHACKRGSRAESSATNPGAACIQPAQHNSHQSSEERELPQCSLKPTQATALCSPQAVA